jgi:hypothetical protein
MLALCDDLSAYLSFVCPLSIHPHFVVRPQLLTRF